MTVVCHEQRFAETIGSDRRRPLGRSGGEGEGSDCNRGQERQCDSEASENITARQDALVNAGSVKKTERGQGKYPKGEYSINPYMMNELLDEILLSREKHSEPSSSANTFENGNPDSYPDIGKFDNLTTAISNLLQSPWGNTPRDWKEIQRALRHNSMIFSDGSVTGTLTLMYQDHRLRRVKEGRSFRYLVP